MIPCGSLFFPIPTPRLPLCLGVIACLYPGLDRRSGLTESVIVFFCVFRLRQRTANAGMTHSKMNRPSR